MTEPELVGYHHVTLNVSDVERSARWYVEVLGFRRLTAFDTDGFSRVVLSYPRAGITLALNRHTAEVADERFDERRTGLDHVAFRVGDRKDLDAWVERLAAHGVTYSPPKPATVPGAYLVSFRDPDDIQLELFVMPPTP